MLRSKIVAAALAAAMSLSVVPESFARGGFGGHFSGGHFGGGARFGGFAARPGFVGARPGFVGPRAAFFPHRRFFAPGLAFGAGLALGGYPYYNDPYYYGYGPGYYDPGYYYGDAPVTVSPDAVSYCMQRFRTYDPATGTYIGRGGVRLSCP
jgi:hypothetical protein